MFRKLLLAALFLTLGSVAVLAADFNGKWTADITTPRGTQTVTFDFHIDGAALTGTVTTPRGDVDISNGKVDGAKVYFEVARPGRGGGDPVTNTVTAKRSTP